MEINFKIQIKELNGTLAENYKVNEVIGNLLAGDTKPRDALKQLNLAKKIYESGIVEVDDSDYNYLQDFIKAAQLPTIVVGQILESLDSQKLENKKNKKEVK